MLLRLALGTWLATASADLVTTYDVAAHYTQPRFTTTGQFQVLNEANPYLHPLQSQPALLVSALAAQDAAEVWAVQRFVAPRHPKWAIAAYIAGALMNGWLAAHNVQHMRQLDAMTVRGPVFVPR